MRKFWRTTKKAAIFFVPVTVCSIAVLIVLGTYTHIALSHEPPTFAPYAGYSKVSTIQSLQTFYFNASAIDAWNGSNGGTSKPHPHRAYEHDTKLSPKGTVEYNGSWDSNQPAKYLDNWFGDDTITDLTIGSDDAKSFQPVTQYWHYVNVQATGQGSPTTMNVNLSAQLLYRTWPLELTFFGVFPAWSFCVSCQINPPWPDTGEGGHSAAACCNFIHDSNNVGLHNYTANLTNPYNEYWTYP